MRAVWAEIDLGAVAHNVGLLRERAGAAELCAVVKADGYGHGAVAVSRAALGAGASCLAVALVEEGVELRMAGITAPVLVLAEPPPADLALVVAHALTPVVYRRSTVAALGEAVEAAGADPVPVHVKLNTGMNRVGADGEEFAAVVEAVAASPQLRLDGVLTHLAMADEPDDGFTDLQLARFTEACTALEAAGIELPRRHAANSAGTLCHPDSRLDLVRCGIALYGIPPAPALRGELDLRPALRLRAAVSHLRTVGTGEGISYGQRHVCDEPTVVATVPVGYADGVPRRLPSLGAEVLVGGRRCPMVGVVTMDQLMVALGPPGGRAEEVALGDEVVLLGEQGGERILADEWAALLDTIAYEIVCAIGPRVPRLCTGPEPA
jgi:alanine racemase